MRSNELVLAIFNDPTRTDPLAAIVYKRLSDAGRLMQKSQNRFHFAVHTYELTKEEDDRNIYRNNQGPIAGVRQAAIMLGGKLETDDNGFVITFDGAYEPLHLNKSSEGEWKTNAKKAMTNANSAQLNSRPTDLEKDDLLLAVPHGNAGAIQPEGAAAEEGKSYAKKKKEREEGPVWHRQRD